MQLNTATTIATLTLPSLPDSVKNAVFQEIERQAGVDLNTLKVIRAEYRVWNDGCLGVQKPGIYCLQV